MQYPSLYALFSYIKSKYALSRAKWRDYEKRNISPCSWLLLAGFAAEVLPRKITTEYFAGDINYLTHSLP
jgi:hypothetical protein